MNILVTGGAGFIGSHTCLELLNAGHDVIVVDNLSNSSEESLKRVKELTGKDILFYQADLLDYGALDEIFDENVVDAVIHFAGLKAVGESVSIPLRYYHNNLTGTFNLLDCMQKHGVFNLVFSSSATVYGTPEKLPITEDFPLSTTNPYGTTKLMIEQILQDLYVSDSRFSIVILRYFNPIGAHESGRIGEDPRGIPNNLLPYIAQVATGKLKQVSVYGNDYPTVDGTGVRDYIHVVDLSIGHLKAIEKKAGNPGVYIYNLGTGRGYSVLEMIHAFEKACGKELPYQIIDRRPGDVAVCYSNPEKAKSELDWSAKYDIEKMCQDAWNWQSHNPEGYRQ
ncbi:MAG: UDP-glucose 4-epimerase GalE [Anaerocolumna aminovalerica]|jgi:UDP-glucose 4-epimerase|uniref:UDP-glucose 4-epimerase GalE n=1 Tax=Anaerocolumna aminovalerica TaxID=1527 RepID=UPI002915A081|nr:UDP-glucose 4-epimerase GalE [Anaerocolumna aminovalerica]MDU6265548.1 UDP-glucose 4-epimerase GalE [Anaerocolumna aminovalerica]